MLKNNEAHSQGDNRRLLFFSLEDWDKVWRRNQFICEELLRRYGNLQILWVSPPFDLSYNNGFDPSVLRLEHSKEINGLVTYKPLKLLPNVFGKSINNSLMRLQLGLVMKTLGWKQFDVWVNDQKARNFLPKSSAGKLIYDVTDDWTEFKQPPRVMRAVIADDLAMLGTADDIIVCSNWLYKKNNVENRKVHLVPNGVDGSRYSPKVLANLEAPDTLKNFKQIAGYVGTLHSERLDLDLVAQAADLLPNVTFAFIGPNLLSAADSAKLSARANIKLVGAVGYDELPRYLKAIDVCMTPHKVNSFTESLDPLKLYEYMSTGKPIVSTPCSGFRDLQDLVSVCGNANDFAQAIREALEHSDPDARERKIEWSMNQSWSQRVDEVVRILGW